MDQQQIRRIKEVIIEAGKIAIRLKNQGLKVTIKPDGSPVTNADIEISHYIFTELSKITPLIPIICEERQLLDVSDNRAFWLIDPIDGTRSYIKNRDSYTINIALIQGNEPTYGFVYLPVYDRLYFTDENKNLCILENDKIVEFNQHNHKGHVAVVSSNNFNSDTNSYLKNRDFAEVIVIPSSIKLCLVAEGAGDVYPKFGPTMEWDIAAGHALIKAAGGSVCDLENKEIKYAKEGFNNSNFIAANYRWLKRAKEKV